MTRKQAILAVIEHIENDHAEDAELCKAAGILSEVARGIPGKIWLKEDIRAAVDRFVNENGRPPKVKELDSVPYLPPHMCIKSQYGTTAGEWLRRNYPGCGSVPGGRYAAITAKQLREIFTREFERIQPSSAPEYDRRRDKGTPGWSYIAKRLGAGTWVGLKQLCRVKAADRPHPELNVESHIPHFAEAEQFCPARYGNEAERYASKQQKSRRPCRAGDGTAARLAVPEVKTT